MARKFSGERLASLRQRRELTRAQLAARITDASGIEVSENTVAAWERGENRPGIDTAFALAAALCCTLDELAETVSGKIGAV